MNVSQATRERHFRSELKQEASGPLEKVLKEFKPRLRHWFRETISTLKDSYHVQTDPLRYRHQGQEFGVADDVVRSDIVLLKHGGNGNMIDSNEAVLKANPAYHLD